MSFQRRTWIAERIGWTAMGLVIAAAMLGAFAQGPLSRTTLRDPQGLLTIEYGWLQRRTAPTIIRIQVAPEAFSPDGVVIEVDRALVDALRISAILPDPARSVAAAYGLRFRFDAMPGQPATIRFDLNPERIGMVRPALGLVGHPPVELPMFIYP
jgi:hypothetical protein